MGFGLGRIGQHLLGQCDGVAVTLLSLDNGDAFVERLDPSILARIAVSLLPRAEVRPVVVVQACQQLRRGRCGFVGHFELRSPGRRRLRSPQDQNCGL